MEDSASDKARVGGQVCWFALAPHLSVNHDFGLLEVDVTASLKHWAIQYSPANGMEGRI